MAKLLHTVILIALIGALTVTAGHAYVIKGIEAKVDAADIRIEGKRYILLTDVCKANGLSWEWDSVSRKIFLRRDDGQEAVFLAGSRYYYEEKRIKRLTSPVRMKNGVVWVPLNFAKYTVRQIFKTGRITSRPPGSMGVTAARRKDTKKVTEKRFRIAKVVIDAGHGGKDPGAIGRTKLKEKDVILDVAKRIKKILEKKGIDVIMTRKSDRFISLGERARIANRNKADLFVSIHANASRRRWVKGFEVYYLSEAADDNARAIAAAENSDLETEKDSFSMHTKSLDAIVWDLKFTEHRRESIELAGFICQEVNRKLKIKNNNIKSARFYVLKGAEMPAVLVELSYLSNKRDERNLKKSSYKQKLAEGVAGGILAYKDDFEITNGFSQ